MRKNIKIRISNVKNYDLKTLMKKTMIVVVMVVATDLLEMIHPGSELVSGILSGLILCMRMGGIAYYFASSDTGEDDNENKEVIKEEA